MIRQKEYPTIKQKLWGNALWLPSYFAGSCGGTPIDIVRQYIEQQKSPHYDCFAIHALYPRPKGWRFTAFFR